MINKDNRAMFLVFANTLKTSEILNVMGFENEKDFFVLKPDEEILSYDDDCVRKNQALCARVCEHIKSEHKNISSLNDDEKYFYLNRKIIEAEPVIPKRVADIISFSALYAYNPHHTDKNGNFRVMAGNNGVFAVIYFGSSSKPEVLISKNMEIGALFSDPRFGPLAEQADFYVPMSNGEVFLDEKREHKWLDHKSDVAKLGLKNENSAKAVRYLQMFPSQNYLTQYQIETKFRDKQKMRKLKKLENFIDKKMMMQNCIRNNIYQR